MAGWHAGERPPEMTGTWIDWPLLSISIFNAIALFWLGLTVLLNTARRSTGTWVITVGLLGGALFFISHTAILGIGANIFSSLIEIWWRLAWIPLIILPLCWYYVVLWYAGFPDPARVGRRHRFLVPAMLILALLMEAGILLPAWMPTFSAMAAMRSLDAIRISSLPVLVTGFPIFSLFCISLSIAVLRSNTPAVSLEFVHARKRAFPWLVAVSIALLIICLTVAGGMVWLSLNFNADWTESRLTWTVAVFDLVISGLVGFTNLFLGQALVRYEVFLQAVVPRKEFGEGWRRVVILGAGYGAVAGGALYLGLHAVYILLLTALIMTTFTAMRLWRSIGERREFIRQLRPFITAQGQFGNLLESDRPEAAVFQSLGALSRYILGVRSILLVPQGGYAPLVRRVAYPEAGDAGEIGPIPAFEKGDLFRQINPSESGYEWAVPLWSGEALAGVLYLGQKSTGSGWVQEAFEIAQAAGERMLDTAASIELGRRLALLQKERLVETRVSDQRVRRVLHDEILPQLHAARISLAKDHEAGRAIDASHRLISEILMNMPQSTAPEFDRQGVFTALEGVLATELHGQFDQVTWDVDDAASDRARTLREVEREVVFYALREALRNAAYHARGPAPLRIDIVARCQDGLRIEIRDDGMGFRAPEDGHPETGGRGLLLHSTLVALLGGEMLAESLPGKGTSVRLRIPG